MEMIKVLGIIECMPDLTALQRECLNSAIKDLEAYEKLKERLDVGKICFVLYQLDHLETGKDKLEADFYTYGQSIKRIYMNKAQAIVNFLKSEE